MEQDRATRRSFIVRIGTAVGAAGLAAQGGVFVRSFVPNVSYEPPSLVKVGPPDSFADGLTFVPDRRLFIHRDGKVFRAISAVCTHLGCTIRAESLLEVDPADRDGKRQKQTWRFSCPCHGSRYQVDGSNISGPAPAPLPVYRLALAPDDGSLTVDLEDAVGRDIVLTLP